MVGLRLIKWISRIEYYKYPRYCGLQERRQLICFLLASLVEFIYIPANLLGLNSYHRSDFFDFYNWFQLTFVLGLQIGFWINKVSTRTALYILFISVTMKLSAESLYQVFDNGAQSSYVFGNFNVILTIVAVSIAVKLTRLSVILMVMLTSGLAVCSYIGDNIYIIRAWRIFFVGYVLIFFVLSFNTKAMAIGLREPRDVDEEERRALQMLISLNENEREKVLSLMDRLSPEQKEKLRRNVEEHFRDREFEELLYHELCSELTKSEIEICKLTLQGKTIKEISDALDKNVANITSQRSHIRKKLHMDKKEELQSTLEIRIHQIREKMESKEKRE